MGFTEPNIRIFQMKLDLEAMYRQLYVTVAIVILTITIIGRIAYILSCLPFGVANGSNNYSIISEAMMDLTNIIFVNDTFDLSEIYSPL